MVTFAETSQSASYIAAAASILLSLCVSMTKDRIARGVPASEAA